MEEWEIYKITKQTLLEEYIEINNLFNISSSQEEPVSSQKFGNERGKLRKSRSKGIIRGSTTTTIKCGSKLAKYGSGRNYVGNEVPDNTVKLVKRSDSAVPVTGPEHSN